jgi:hypothetical protein
MKYPSAVHAAVLLFAATCSRSFSQTFVWGSSVGDSFADSNGQILDDSYVFQMGAFIEGFEPDESNVDTWLANWRVFDQAGYNQDMGYFTHWSNETDSLRMLDDGTSNSPYLTSGASSFEGLRGYLWIRRGDQPVEGSEWLLTRAADWMFPTASPGCCNTDAPIQWSVSDLDTSGEMPKWGAYGDTMGPGSHTSGGNFTLQTYTFAPEPSAMMLVACAALTMLRRRRQSLSP